MQAQNRISPAGVETWQHLAGNLAHTPKCRCAKKMIGRHGELNPHATLPGAACKQNGWQRQRGASGFERFAPQNHEKLHPTSPTQTEMMQVHHDGQQEAPGQWVGSQEIYG